MSLYSISRLPDFARRSPGHAARRNIPGDDRACSDNGMGADCHARHDHHAHADPDIVLDNDFFRARRLLAHGDIAALGAVGNAAHSRAAGNHTMIADLKPGARLIDQDAGAEGDINAGPHPTLVDADAAVGIEDVFIADVRDLGFIQTDSADLIYACHVLEHFGRHEYLDVLREWARVLKPGGILRLSVPDFAACAALYYEQGLVDGLTGLIGLISGGQRDDMDYHRMIFDEAFLAKSLQSVGFGDVRRWDWRHTEHTHVDDFSQAYIPHLAKDNGRLMSLNIEAVKTA